MPPEPLPFERKDFFKERRPASSDSLGVVPERWRQPSATPLHQGSSSANRWGGGGGGSSDFRRPFSGHGKQGGGWHMTTVEPGSRGGDVKYCRNNNSRENTNNCNWGSVSYNSQKDWKGGHYWETTASPNSNSHPPSDFVNSWDQLQSKDQHDKNNGGGVSNIGGQHIEKEGTLGPSIDWKPFKWVRSGSLSSRGSGFSHSSGSKSIGVDSLDLKVETQPGNTTPLQSPSGDVAPCVTSRAPAEETGSRKKPRLGWGEGLAKYEKKKVDGPDETVDKEALARNGSGDGVSNSEPLRSVPANLDDKSLSLTGYSECASPATPSSVACSSSPGVEEKVLIKGATSNLDSGNRSVSNCYLSQNQTDGLAFNLENLELTQVVNLSSSLNELLQSDDSSAVACGFVRSTAMDKLQVWKANISKTLEVTESEIDSLENELRLLISDVGGSCPCPAVSSSLTAAHNDKNSKERLSPSSLRIISSGDKPVEKADGATEGVEVKHLDVDSPGTATSNFVEPFSFRDDVSHSDTAKQSDCPVNLDIKSENIEANMDGVSDKILGVVTASGDGRRVPADSSLSALSIDVDVDVHLHGEDKLYDLILASNRDIASRVSKEFNKLLPTTQWHNDVSRTTSESMIKEKFAMRKRFLKFKERVITLKFRVFQYLWKEDLRLLSIRRLGVKSQKKPDLSSLAVHNGYHKNRSSIRSRFSFPAGNLSLVPTTEIIDYTNKLLSDSQFRIYRNTLKMPALILDKRERMASRFISDNGLVEDPCAVEKERCVMNPWTSKEKEIFLDKFALFGKDFRRIASFLEHKTVADCVEFYYKNHKSDRFQKTKKNPDFAKQGKSCSTNTYLVTSGKRWHRDMNAASLNMLGAASAIASNADGGMERQRKCTSKFYIGTSSDHRLPRGEGGIIERSNSLVLFGNERETAAADVLAGICGSMSSEALSSCVTSAVDRGDAYHQEWRCQKKRWPLTPEVLQDVVDEETCSDDSCGGEMDPADWTDEEKSRFIRAVASYGKDFSMISRCMRTRSREQCKVFFSKARKCLGLDTIHPEPGNEGANNANGGSGSDHEDTCMVGGGSVIPCDKFSLECTMEVENVHLSDSKSEHFESGLNAVNDCREPELAENKLEMELVGERIVTGSDGEPIEASKLEEAPKNTDPVNVSSEEAVSAREMIDQPSSSGAEVEADTVNGASPKLSREGIRESAHQLSSGDRFDADVNEMRGLNSCPAEPEGLGGSSLDLSTDHGNGLELNAAEKPSIVSPEQDTYFRTSNSFPQGSSVIAHSNTLSEDSTLSRLSFRKSNDRLSQRSSSTDDYHRHLPNHSLLDCVESSHAPRSSYPAMVSTNEGKNSGFSYSEPGDCSLQKCSGLNHDKGLVFNASLPEDQKQSSSSDVEMPSRSCDVKLFGQILTHPSSQQQPKPKCATQENDDKRAGKFLNLKFDTHSTDRNLASPNLDRSNNNLPSRSCGFWDGSRIQTGFPSLPDSTVLLAKYPAAFGNSFTSSKLEQSSNEQLSVNVMSGLSSNNRGTDYHVYRSREFVHPFTADKFMQRRNESESTIHQGRSMVGINVVGRDGGILVGGVSDPVAAIKMHYAEAEQYKNGRSSREAESWRSGGGDVGR